MSSFHTSIQGRDNNDSAESAEKTEFSTSLFNADHSRGFQSAKESSKGLSWSSKTPAPRATDTFGTKSTRQDRATTLSSTKKQEEIYLSQVRLMQWYLMNKRATEHFSAQEKSAETQFELVGRSLLEKQVKIQNLQKRLEVEQDLVELESTLGCQRDQLLSIIDGLDAFKADYEEFTEALDREARVLNIPGIDDTNLDQWLGQIKDCQSVLDMSSRRSSKDYELVQAIAQVMQELCSIVKEEIQEMRQCATLATKLREAETIEATCLLTTYFAQLATYNLQPQLRNNVHFSHRTIAEQVAPVPSALTGGIMMPVQQLLSPNEGVMDALSGLSTEQLSSMEETIRRAKMSRQQQSSVSTATVALSTPVTTRSPPNSTPASNMKQFMSIMNTPSKDTLPLAKPLIKTVGGVPWLTFTYATRSAVRTAYTVRADIDQVSMDDIPLEFQMANCLYPSANGVEEEYKGSRRDYERECNEQGWKLAHMNPTILSERKGILQRAVISLRNVSSEQKSRRVKRQEKRTQGKVVAKNVRGPMLPIPRLTGPNLSRVLLSGPPLRPNIFLPLTWQPAMVSSLHDGAQRPGPSDLTPQELEPQLRAQRTTPPPQRLPSLGSFATSSGGVSSLEFDGYIQGQFKRLRLQVNISDISLDDLSYDFKKNNCVYPRSFQTQDDTSEHWNTYGIRQSEESFLNEIGWKLCSVNSGLLKGKRLLLQQALDAYRRRFLPSTGQPRARVGPSLLTRRNSSSNPVYSLFNGSDPTPRSTRHRNQQARVRFDTQEPITLKVHVNVSGEPYRGDEGGLDKSMNEIDAGEHGDGGGEEDYGEEEGDDGEGEDFDEVNGDFDDEGPSEGDSFEDESGDGSSSEEVFHSQMSLLSFTGSIRTYSLGTGSGSARSRPRIHPTAASVASAAAATGSSRNASSPLSRSETLPTKKRSWTEFTPQTHLNGSNGRVRFDKRIRYGVTEGYGSPHQEAVSYVLGNEQQGHEDRSEPNGVEGEDDGDEGEAGEAVEDGGERESDSESEQEEGYNEDEDDVDWWKSRLNNSEYAEDQQMVSMTTEELIGALTNCYNSDVEDYYDEED
ncbi:hypothetical protein BGW39_011043 [Mortierella sp. 14UC]|nr:hypothetical protein BGW39_011043 [Mortierella sp. 14UC]